MKICSDCKENYSLVGRKYKRKNSNKTDYWCSNCHSKLKPIEAIDDKDFVDEVFDMPIGNSKKFDADEIALMRASSKRDKEEIFDSVDYKWKEVPIGRNTKINFPPIDDCVEFTNELTPNPLYKGDTKRYENILLIGDLHAPANLPNYLDFCSDIYDKYNCDHIIFMGDLIDLHASSFHSTDPDGLNAGDELNAAINEIQKWSKVFPVADVVLGNHDLIVMRKAFKEGISKRWIRDFNEVLDVEWNFQPSFEYNNCLFRHGLGMKAAPKAGSEMMNVCQSHFHTESYVNYKVGRGKMVFGMQVPCGVDREHYAMIYAKEFPKQAIGCGVLLEQGRLPLIEMMRL